MKKTDFSNLIHQQQSSINDWSTPWPPAENPGNAPLSLIEDNESDEDEMEMHMFQNTDERYRLPTYLIPMYGRDNEANYSPHLTQAAEQLRSRYMVPCPSPGGNDYYFPQGYTENIYSTPNYPTEKEPSHLKNPAMDSDIMAMSSKERLDYLKNSVPEEHKSYLPYPPLNSINLYSKTEPALYQNSRQAFPPFEMQESDDLSTLDSDDDSDMHHGRFSSDNEDGSSHKMSVRHKLSRKQFRETIGTDLYTDLESGKFSYEEVIDKYKRTYPEFAHKFTRNFCSKVRCGRILVNTTGAKQRCVKNGDPRMKRIPKISNRRTWTKMTHQLFTKIYDWEQVQTQPVKQQEIENTFNVNRSTYYRWKRRYENSTKNEN